MRSCEIGIGADGVAAATTKGQISAECCLGAKGIGGFDRWACTRRSGTGFAQLPQVGGFLDLSPYLVWT